MTKTTMIVCAVRSTLPLAWQIIENCSDRQFHLVAEYLPPSFAHKLSKITNTRHHSEAASAIASIPRCHSLITFGCSAHPSHKLAATISLAFQAVSKPRLDVQHGLLQVGYTIPGSTLDDETLNISDMKIGWEIYGVPLPIIHRSSFQKRRIGISSNLHWMIYSDRERSLFRNCVIDIARRFPDVDFIWRPHPGEFLFQAGEYPRRDDLGVLRHNIRVQSFSEIEGTTMEDFLRDTDLLISTPSTTLLDAERADLPCIVFDSRYLAKQLRNFEQISLFRRSPDLIDLVDGFFGARDVARFRSGYSMNFDHARFWKDVEKYEADVSQLSVEEQIRLASSSIH